MPTYKFKCPECGKEKSWASRWEPVCKECGIKMMRVFSPASFILKGGGYFSAENRK